MNLQILNMEEIIWFTLGLENVTSIHVILCVVMAAHNGLMHCLSHEVQCSVI